jgi:hypothetical protein
MNERDLLDSYLDALARDPNAPVPPGLDANFAAFVRDLAQTDPSANPALSPAVQRRVWKRALAEAQKQAKKERPMQLSMQLSKPTLHRPGALTLGAAGVVMLILCAALLSALNRPDPDGSDYAAPGAGVQAQESATPSPLPSLVPAGTATLLPTEVQPVSTLIMGTLQPPVIINESTATPVQIVPTVPPLPNIDATEVQPMPIPGSRSGTLTAEQDTVLYELTAESDALLRIAVGATNGNVAAVIAYSDGNAVAQAYSGYAEVNEMFLNVKAGDVLQVFVVLGDKTTTDDYVLHVDPAEQYELTFEETDAGLPRYTAFAQQMATSGVVSAFTFSAEAGDVLDIMPSRIAAGYDGWDRKMILEEISDSQERLYLIDSDSGQLGEPEFYNLRIPRTGTYRIIVMAEELTNSISNRPNTTRDFRMYIGRVRR